MAWLLPGPRQVGATIIDVHTLLYAAAAILIGYQSVVFSVLTKVFAIQEGLLPEDPRLNRLFRTITLETGLLVGAALLGAGLLGSILAVGQWSTSSFGPLPPEIGLRRVIPSALAMVLGCETILASSFLSVLGLRVRRLA